MHTRSLAGSTVTAIGCGDVSLGIAASRGVDHREVERALHEALTLGLSLIDVHDEDDAERLTGEAVRSLRLRDRTSVATRIAPRASTPGFEVRDVLHERLPAAHVQERLESSLRMTGLPAYFFQRTRSSDTARHVVHGPFQSGSAFAW